MSRNMSPKSYPPEYLAEDISGTLMATAIAFAVIETVVMLLMYAARWAAKGERRNLSMEVYMTLTYVVCLGKITVAILLVQIGGAGRHLAALQPATVITALKLSTALQIVCPLTTSLSKLGVLCFFHRIFAQSGRWYRSIIRATFIFVVAIMLAQVLIPFVNCRPFEKTWDPRGSKYCTIPGLSLWRYIGIPNVFTTLIIVALPVPALARLHVSRPMKLGLVVVFLVCIAGIVAAIMRFESFLAVKDFHDITYENVKPLCWTVAESGIYLVAGVLPTLKPLIRKVFKNTALERLLTRSTRQSRSWESRRFSRRWHQREPRAVVPDTKQRSASDATAERVALTREAMPTAHGTDVRWI